MIKTIEKINEKIKKGEAVVLSAEEIIDPVRGPVVKEIFFKLHILITMEER